MMIFFYKGLILGFSVAAPIGPIGILCINRTLRKGQISGLVTGLGATTADLFYGLIAGFGLTMLSGFMLQFKLWLQVVGLVSLFYFGTSILLKNQKSKKILVTQQNGLFNDYLSTFILTISNPVTIIFFISVFAGLGLSNTGKATNDILALVLGVFLGSGMWWAFLSILSSRLKSKLHAGILKWIDIASGITLILFGIYIAIDLLN